MTGYAFHPEAAIDLSDIWDFIAEDSPAAADRVIEDIVVAIEGLANAPYIGHRRPELTARPIRFCSVRNYLVAYAPDKQPLCIIAVRHGKRSPRVKAAILRGRE